MISLLFSVVKHAASYFHNNVSDASEINDINEAIGILEEAKEDDAPNSQEAEIPLGQSCYYKTGIVTVVNSDYILVDDRCIYETVNRNAHNFKVGDKIYYLAYQKDKNQEEKICKIIDVINDSWDNSSKECERVIRAGVLKRSIVGKVKMRQGRNVIIEPNDICFNLDEVRSDFVPFIGDWLKAECTVEVNEDSTDLSGEVLEVDKIQPLRSKLTVGIVNSYDSEKEMGVIEGGIVFSKRICEAGYNPCVGDKVVSDSIESDQNIYMWRSLTVVPLEQISSKHSSNLQSPYLIDKGNVLFKDKCGISVSDDLKINLNIHEQQEISVVVKNASNICHRLCRTYFTSKKAQSQLILLQPAVDTMTILNPNDEISYKFNCRARFIGRSEEIFVFHFSDFEIGRVFQINVNSKYSLTRADYGTDNHRKDFKFNKEQLDEGTYIPGIRPCKPPNFIKVRNGIFKVPRYYWDAVLTPLDKMKSKTEYELAVSETIPCLLTDLRFETYKDRFHALLYLEEIAVTMELQRYSMDSAVLKRHGEYLVLQVLGLAENRPSLLIGDRVIISRKWDSTEGHQKYEGYIHKTTSTEVFLKFNQNFHEQYNGEDCQVSFKSSNSTFNRCHNAVNQAVVRLGPEFLFPTRVVQKKPQLYLEEAVNGIDSASKQRQHRRSESNTSTSSSNTTATSISESSSETSRSFTRVSVAERLFNVKSNQHSPDITNSSVCSTSKDQNGRSNLAASPTETDLYTNRIKKRKLTWYSKKLNDYQKTAVRNILLGLARPLPYIIFGPPGTGKTITLCETILQILTTVPESRLLIATPSNSSANLIVERLLDSGILKPGDLVRLIAHHCLESDSIPARLLPYCATAELAAEGSRARNECSRNGVSMNCTMSMLGRHRITVGTCVALGILHNMGFPRGHFTHVLIDEAGQATEPEILIPLNFIHSDCGQVILAGDPMQLGPVVQSRLAKNFGYGESFLSRLLHCFPYQRDPEGFEMGYDQRLVTKLVINYRSLPEILQISNKLFYESELIPQVCPEESLEAKLLRSLSEELPEREGSPPAIIFHGIHGENYRDSDSPSWYNPAEATQVYFYLLKLYNRGLSADDIGVITPYQKQVYQIRDLLLELDVETPKVSSVEGFQGQERKVIILSTVRSSKNLIHEDVKHSLGFIASPRRLNVAITRARALLIILGNPWLLAEDTHWRSVLKYCIDQGGYTGCNFLPLEEMQPFTGTSDKTSI